MEGGGCEEEAGSPPGERIKPIELLKPAMDGETFCLYARAIYLISTNPSVSQLQYPGAKHIFLILYSHSVAVHFCVVP